MSEYFAPVTKYQSSGLKQVVEKTSSDAQSFLDESGVSDKAKKVVSTIDEHVDILSGQRLLQLVEERLALQAKYNDILATRLDEAITKIRELELEIKSLKNKSKDNENN